MKRNYALTLGTLTVAALGVSAIFAAREVHAERCSDFGGVCKGSPPESHHTKRAALARLVQA